jgi:hypothetical protein
LVTALSPLIAQQVPVVQGFIGSTATGATTTIGRGGSDYSAAVVGAALDAEEIEIWTDVDGILTTDPRVVPEAAKVRTISFAEAAELAYFGAKVLHPSTLLPAMKKDIPVSVRNSRKPEREGTMVVRNAPPSRNLVKAIAFKRGITIVNVSSARMLMAYGFLSRLFDIFARHKTAVDMVSTSEVSVSMTLDDARNLDSIIPEIEELGEVQVERDQALVSLVGDRLKVTPGVAARIFSSIDKINVSMISHGASAINVSFIVAGEQVEDAVRALHTEFFDEIDSETFESPAVAATSEIRGEVKIALSGYGKMGQLVDRVATSRGHETVARFDIDNNIDGAGITSQQLNQAQVAIDFSTPDVVVTNIRRFAELRVPIVVGTTGWYDRISEVKAIVLGNDSSLVYAANFSIGMNLFSGSLKRRVGCCPVCGI